MLHCPYCGSFVKTDENFCVECGKALPPDIVERTPAPPGFNRWWILPISSFIILMVILASYYYFLNQQEDKAIEKFKLGEKYAIEENYSEAKTMFDQALAFKSSFPAAKQNKNLLLATEQVFNHLDQAEHYKLNSDYQEGLTHLQEAEKELENYNGDLVNRLLEKIIKKRNELKVAQINDSISANSDIESLKSLLWQAEGIQSKEAEEVANEIRARVISYFYSMANQYLQEKQFSLARETVEEGLHYASDSKKLSSLKTTIEKEKVAFETAQQQRIEQAIEAAEKDQEINEEDAVDLMEINYEIDEYGEFVVKGKIKSVATIPIYSISVIYDLINSDGEVVQTNEIFVYPDTLYPNEIGEFEYTHYDLKEPMKVEVQKIRWFFD